jgi:hypothetical protein
LREFDDSMARARVGPLRNLRAPALTDERQIEIPWVLSRHGGVRRVLDVGYAYAPMPYLKALAAFGADELVGVHLVERAVAGVRSVIADVRALPFDDETFDLVLRVSTLEHVGWDNTVYGLPAERDSAGMLVACGEHAGLPRRREPS